MVTSSHLKSSTGYSHVGPFGPAMPALLTSTSMPPCRGGRVGRRDARRVRDVARRDVRRAAERGARGVGAAASKSQSVTFAPDATVALGPWLDAHRAARNDRAAPVQIDLVREAARRGVGRAARQRREVRRTASIVGSGIRQQQVRVCCKPGCAGDRASSALGLSLSVDPRHA